MRHTLPVLHAQLEFFDFLFTKKQTKMQTMESMETQMAANVARSVNAACRARGAPFDAYSCKLVSWDDVSRSNFAAGGLSCYGSNITDTRLFAKSGAPLWTLRADNWNEKLGKVSSSNLAVMVGSHTTANGGALHPATLSAFLTSVGEFGAYAGLPRDANLAAEELDRDVSVRFQVVFLPLSEDNATLEFAAESYSYQTHENSAPRNMLLLCTTQGTAVRFSSVGHEKLFHHAAEANNKSSEYWLEAEASSHKVGGAQTETDAEAAAAAVRGKAVSAVIGVPGLGTRFNVLMTIQVPLQVPLEEYDNYDDEAECGGDDDWGGDGDEDNWGAAAVSVSASASASGGCVGVARLGTSTAARVSRGTCVGPVTPHVFEPSCPKRDPTQHITATIVLYYTVANGLPREADIVAAVHDLESLYASVDSGHLADAKFDTFKDSKDSQAVAHAPPSFSLAQVPQGRTVWPGK
jgi:hypothetical protein